MKNFMIGNLKAGFICNPKLKEQKRKFGVSFDTIPFAVEMVEEPVSSIFSKEFGIGGLNLTFVLNKNKPLKDRVINHVYKEFDIGLINVEGIGTIEYTLIPAIINLLLSVLIWISLWKAKSILW